MWLESTYVSIRSDCKEKKNKEDKEKKKKNDLNGPTLKKNAVISINLLSNFQILHVKI